MAIMYGGKQYKKAYWGGQEIAGAFANGKSYFAGTPQPIPLDEFHYYAGEDGGSMQTVMVPSELEVWLIADVQTFGRQNATQKGYEFTGSRFMNTEQYILFDDDYIKKVEYLDNTKWSIVDKTGHKPGLLYIQLFDDPPITGRFRVTTDGDSGPRVTTFTFNYTN